MGWKLGCIIVPSAGDDLAAGLKRFYGGKRKLIDAGKSVEEVVTDVSSGKVHAIRHDGFDWIFDQATTERALTQKSPMAKEATFLLLHSVVNLYRFGIAADGKWLRQRSGASDDGVIINGGPMLNAETRELQRIFAHSTEKQIEAFWSSGTETLMSGADEYTHDSVGENVVFAVMKNMVGFRLDEPSSPAELFNAQPVYEVKKAGLFG
jgi:hypothetical protein